MSVKRLFNARQQFFDSNGDPLNGGQLFVYTAGSSNKVNTYNSSSGLNANTDPLILDSSGRLQSEVWVTSGVSVKLVLATSSDTDPPATPTWTEDNISGINDTTVTIDQWIAGPAPTYVSATSFTLVGDQTSTFHVGRRLKTTNSGGSIYSRISASVYGVLTTVTVVNDSSTLDAGLSAVSYGIQSADNNSTPLLTDAYPLRSGSADKTKLVRFEVDGLTTGTTRVITVPDADITLANWSTGDVKLTLKTTADSGWVLMNDGTIGNASSAGTTRANADTVDLFTLLWNNTVDANCAVSTGRGANAAADYAANKTIALPKALGRALGAFGAGSGLTSRALAVVAGVETVTLTAAESGLPAHTHTVPLGNTDGAGALAQQVTAASGNNATAASTGGTAAANAHTNMQPTVFLNVMIKL